MQLCKSKKAVRTCHDSFLWDQLLHLNIADLINYNTVSSRS